MVEDGHIYSGNATNKAVAFSQISGLIVLGDDSGLEVDGLDSQPGLHSHCVCPLPNAIDATFGNICLNNYQMDRVRRLLIFK